MRPVLASLSSAFGPQQRRNGVRLLLLAVGLLLADARPAAADNCSGLSDCYFVSKSAVTVTVGIGTVAVVLLLTPPIGGSPDVKPLDPDKVPKTPRPAEKEAAIRTKVRESEQAVAKLPRPRQKALFEGEALAAGQDQAFKALTAAIRRGAPPEEWLPILKPTGTQVTASAVVNAVDAVLDKVPRLVKAGGAATAEALAERHDSPVTQVSDLHEVGYFLAKAGPGARGVVTVQMVQPVSWANATPVHVGHAFNAANLDGRITFLDAQTGGVAATPHELLVAQGHDPATIVSVQFVPTHPRLA